MSNLQNVQFAPAPLDDLHAELLNIEINNGVVEHVEKLVSTATPPSPVVNSVDFRQAASGEAVTPIEYIVFGSNEEGAQRLEIEAIVAQGNKPVDYTKVVVTDANGIQVDTDVFFYRSDGGAWLRQAAGSVASLSSGHPIPWSTAKRSGTIYKGLSTEGISSFPNGSGGIAAVTATTDADIDTDGPNGSKAKDKYWQPHTSLRFADGSSCDSRIFPGVVIPPGMTHEFKIRIGDFALLRWNGKELPVQVYDGGPSDKIGEISFGAAVALGIYPDSSAATETSAANKGNSVDNLLTVFFPGSGNGRAVSSELIKEAVGLCLKKWLGPSTAAPTIAAPAGAQTFAQFIASLNLTHVTLAHALGTTGTAPNEMPAPQLWQNIAPTLVVMDAIAAQLGGGLRVNSTYRNVAYNNVVGGAKRSQHTAFRAVDFSIKNHSPEDVAEVAKSMRGRKFTVPIANLQLTNTIPGLPTPPPLNLSALSLATAGSGTTFIFHGGIQDYDSFVHVDCRGDDVSWA